MRSGDKIDRALVTWLFQMDGLNRLEKKAKAAGLDLNELMNAERSMVGGVVRLIRGLGNRALADRLHLAHVRFRYAEDGDRADEAHADLERVMSDLSVFFDLNDNDDRV
jgi:hypothetical protein